MSKKSVVNMPQLKGMGGRDIFGLALAQLGEENERVVFLVADCLWSTKGDIFAKKFPDRAFNFGIAEANMVGAAAGMTLLGRVPVIAGFGFLMSMRIAEQVRTDLCYPRLNVKIVTTATGLSMGTGGPSHHCTEDIGVMRSFPNMAIVCPGSSIETWKACHEAILEYVGPVYLRLERDPFFREVEELYEKKDRPFKLGKAISLREGKDVTVMGIGKPLGLALQAAESLQKEGISTRVINMHTVKPIDTEAIQKAAEETQGIVAVEEHNTVGGLGDAISSAVCESAPALVKKVGICDEFCCIGPTDEIWTKHGLTAENIIQAVKSILDRRYR